MFRSKYISYNIHINSPVNFKPATWLRFQFPRSRSRKEEGRNEPRFLSCRGLSTRHYSLKLYGVYFLALQQKSCSSVERCVWLNRNLCVCSTTVSPPPTLLTPYIVVFVAVPACGKRIIINNTSSGHGTLQTANACCVVPH